MSAPGDTDTEKIRFWERLAASAAPPAAGVVVVTHDAVGVEQLRVTLGALDEQTVSDFEVVLLDNSPDRDLRAKLDAFEQLHHVVGMKENFGVNVARNVGSRIVDGDVLIFLDHDAVPKPDFVEAHLRAHDTLDVVAARGKVLPKTASIYNALASNYDLGDRPFRYFLDIEGNCSVQRAVYEAVSGFDEDVWGHEGLRLSSRIISAEGSESIVYYPDAVVYHDFATSLYSLVKKKARHERAREKIEETPRDVFELYQDYSIPDGARERHLPAKVGLYLAHRMTNAAGRMLSGWLYSENYATE